MGAQLFSFPRQLNSRDEISGLTNKLRPYERGVLLFFNSAVYLNPVDSTQLSGDKPPSASHSCFKREKYYKFAPDTSQFSQTIEGVGVGEGDG